MSEMSTVDIPISTLCPQCGPKVKVDEDGCCVACGSTAIGEGADAANTAIARVRELETGLADVLAAMVLWGSWEDGIPEAGDDAHGSVGSKFERGLSLLGIDGTARNVGGLIKKINKRKGL